MIQRAQSVYLALGGIALLGLLPFDFVWTSPAADSFSWYTPVAAIAIALAAVGAIGAIFLYNNRPRQRSTVVVVQVITVIAMLVAFGGLYFAGAMDSLLSPLTISSGLFLSLPVLAYILFFMARRSIDKDIALVRSMDRLR